LAGVLPQAITLCRPALGLLLGAMVLVPAVLGLGSLAAEQWPIKVAPAGNGDRIGKDSARSNGNAPEVMPANPVPVEMFTGTGELGRLLGIKPESGFRLGGALVGEANTFLSGSFAPQNTFGNGLQQLQLEANLETLLGWKDTKVSVSGLNPNGSPVNLYAGSIQGFTDLPGTPPFDRTELYTYWIAKGLFDRRLFLRFGKQTANVLFNNVVLGNQDLPSRTELATSGLIVPSLYNNPTLIGRMPVGYNAALGLTVQWFPKGTGNTYLNYGIFDGNGAKWGYQTGLQAPWINNYLFQIAEFGVRWNIGNGKLPAKFAIGAWYQSGLLDTPQSVLNTVTTGSDLGAKANGAMGMYLYGTHRLWYRKPWVNPSGIGAFYQFGFSNSPASIIHQYVGLGLTAYGLLEKRPHDNFGVGLAWAKPNPTKNPELFLLPQLFPGNYGGNPLAQVETPEVVIQLYYQFALDRTTYLEPVLSVIPKPSLIGNPATVAATLRLIKQF